MTADGIAHEQTHISLPASRAPATRPTCAPQVMKSAVWYDIGLGSADHHVWSHRHLRSWSCMVCQYKNRSAGLAIQSNRSKHSKGLSNVDNSKFALTSLPTKLKMPTSEWGNWRFKSSIVSLSKSMAHEGTGRAIRCLVAQIGRQNKQKLMSVVLISCSMWLTCTFEVEWHSRLGKWCVPPHTSQPLWDWPLP